MQVDRHPAALGGLVALGHRPQQVEDTGVHLRRHVDVMVAQQPVQPLRRGRLIDAVDGVDVVEAFVGVGIVELEAPFTRPVDDRGSRGAKRKGGEPDQGPPPRQLVSLHP